jgi:hypothetical protein
MMARTRQHAQNVRTGLVLIATFVALFVGSVIYIMIYH